MNLSQITDYWDHFIPVMTPVLSSQYHLTFWWKLLQCSVLTLQSHANLNKNFIFSSNHITAHSLNHKCFQSLLSPPCLATCVMESLWCQWFSIKLLSSKNNWKVIIIILWIHHLRREGEIGPGTEQRRGLLEQNWPSLKEPRHSVVCWDRDYLIFRTWLSLICPHWEMDNGITSAPATGASH